MKSRGIRIEKVSLRLRGVTRRQAEQRAGSIAREIAQAVAREGTGMPPGRTGVGRISVRLRADGKGSGIADQIHKQWAGE